MIKNILNNLKGIRRHGMVVQRIKKNIDAFDHSETIHVLMHSNLSQHNLDMLLHYAFSKANRTACERLIQFGANVNSKDEEGLSILHKAIFYSDLDIKENEFVNLKMVAWLSDNGADLNQDSPLGTPAMLITEYGMPLDCHVIINKGADLSKEGNHGKNLLTLAVEKKLVKEAENILAESRLKLEKLKAEKPDAHRTAFYNGSMTLYEQRLATRKNVLALKMIALLDAGVPIEWNEQQWQEGIELLRANQNIDRKRIADLEQMQLDLLANKNNNNPDIATI